MLNVTENFKSIIFDNDLISYKILNLSGKEVYVMNVKKLVKFKNDEIVLKMKNQELICVKGENMFLKEISKSGVLICGKINSTEIL